jgi:ketosteroid isomerase-like protein
MTSNETPIVAAKWPDLAAEVVLHSLADAGAVNSQVDLRVELTHQQVFERYLYAGAITRDPEAIAALFTDDGVYESPLVADDHPLRHLLGRDAIRAGTALYHQRPAPPGTMNVQRSASVLHDTADPDIFIAEIDVAFDQEDGRQTTTSLVWIFRLRGGQIALLRDYFTEAPSG